MSVKTKVFKVVIKRQLFILSMWGLGAITGASGLNWYYMVPKLQERTVFEQVEQSKPVAKVEVTKATKVTKDNIDELASLIWERESSKGKNNYSKCEAVGKVNGIGYAIPGDGSFLCFDSHEEEMIALKGWLVAKRASGLTDDEMLCLYSGNNYLNCEQ